MIERPDDTNGYTGAQGTVRSLLRLEGAALFIACTVAYFAWAQAQWWLFAVLFLAPDLALVALLAGRRAAAVAYDATHLTVGPLVLAGIGALTGTQWATEAALIWGAHIGIDRAVGYGLRYPGSFEATHLGPVGQLKRAR
jgi:hypothetical protein